MIRVNHPLHQLRHQSPLNHRSFVGQSEYAISFTRSISDYQSSTSSCVMSRACTVCRAAKMRCVGAEEGGPCNRCKKQNSECIFEKHRRGRKPGSKLSEASKMLRRLEKNLTSARAAAANSAASSSPSTNSNAAARPATAASTDGRNPNSFTSPLISTANGASGWQSSGQTQMSPSGSSGTGSNIQYITIPEYSSQGGQIGGPIKREEGHSSTGVTPMMDVLQHPTPTGGSGSTPSGSQAQNRPDYFNRQRGFSDATPNASHGNPRGVSSPRTSSPSGSESEGSSSKPDDGEDRNNNFNLFPAQALADENKRLSFFHTILNPPDGQGSGSGDDSNDSKDGTTNSGAPKSKGRNRGASMNGAPGAEGGTVSGSGVGGVGSGPFGPFGKPKKVVDFEDPISVGLITEDDANALFELFFLRLNPFICLFDPVLHTVGHVRKACPFLFTCIIMAGCKFWKPHLYPACQQLAHDTCVKVFANGVKSVGIVQSFACMTYWKEPDDQNTWTYIGYACRMAIELGLNRYISKPKEDESDQQLRERRDRERTYLVLFVHDRSLSMQTGRNWMLPEDDLVRTSTNWHDSKFLRPEDVIVAAQVQLRRIAAETTDVFYLHKGQPGMLYSDVNYELLLRGCNGKLTAWSNVWQGELQKGTYPFRFDSSVNLSLTTLHILADGQSFHSSVLSFFRLHVRLFLNSFGLQSSIHTASREAPSLQALSNCYTSALQSLEIVTAEFAPIGMLRYVQDSITVMTAYSAVFLLRLLRHSNTLSDLHEEATKKIYDLISQTADVYQEAALMASSSGSAGYHARFLRSLVAKDLSDKQRAAERRAHKHRDADSTSSSSQHAASPSLLPSPTNAIPSYHPPQHIPRHSFQWTQRLLPIQSHRRSMGQTSQAQPHSHWHNRCLVLIRMVSCQIHRTPKCSSRMHSALLCSCTIRPSSSPHIPVHNKMAARTEMLWISGHINRALHGGKLQLVSQTRLVSQNINTSMGYPMRISIIGDICSSTLDLGMVKRLLLRCPSNFLASLSAF
ncbi:fungal-specific transcription factor domain-containing protein [Cantharellus anzutake]|uniref:fungal-specific transcription factor domain-containing protein n=1 Tax=Cantharellus anzutake TaxID=1750568 RepID=UPI0019071550|nr:fungal-specific transcription factor domain-containing protein [Cantharellus anzutake]KAF8333940.1 fungal-specific transcription factor domain-containing protein [Cantharellus anzutake]